MPIILLVLLCGAIIVIVGISRRALYERMKKYGLDRESYRSLLIVLHQICIMMHMRTTLNIDADLLRKAARLTGVSEKTAIVRMGLEALIAQESARRLAALGGTEKQLRPVPRRRAKSVA